MNNRIYKFRAWDKINQMMHFSSEKMPFVFPSPNEKSGLYEVMQFTGLKDKNGVEIYEGDIVEYDDKKYEVKWHIDRFGMKNLKSEDYLWFDNYSRRERNDKCKIIGNIYENPELLK